MAQTKVSPELHNRPTHVKLDISDKIIRGFTYVIVSLFSLMCIIPFWMIVASSFASEASIRLSGFTLWPSEFSAYSYELLLKSPDQMIGAYVVTICLAVVGTAIGLFIISMTGYALQRRDFPFRNGIMFYIYFTSLFSAGLVPFYLLIVQTLNLRDTYWAVLLPLLMSPWPIVLIPYLLCAGSAFAEACVGHHRPVSGAGVLERVVLFLPVPDLQGGIPSPAVPPVQRH